VNRKFIKISMSVIVLAVLLSIIISRQYYNYSGNTKRVQVLSMAVEGKHQRGVLDALRLFEKIQMGEEGYNNKRERERVVNLIQPLIQKWIVHDFEDWHSIEDERRMIYALICTCPSVGLFGGLGIADTKEGFLIAQEAVQKFNKKYSRPGESLSLTKSEDGEVSLGVLTRYP